MGGNIFVLITIVLCILALLFAWKSYKKENYNTAVFLIMASGLFIYFYTASDFYLHAWDERYHALVAKNLMNHPFKPMLYDNPILSYDYKMWVGNHIWLHKQPLPLWCMATSMKLFGVNEIALRLPSILFSTLGIMFTFKIGTYLYTKKVGLFAAFLFSVNGLIIELTSGRVSTDHVDVAFMFFILLAIFFTTEFIQKKNILYIVLIGVSIGAAILTKWLVGLIIIPIWLILVLDSKAFNLKTISIYFALLLFTIALVALPWQFYIFKEFPLEAAYEANFNLRHFSETIEDRSRSNFYFFNQIRVNYGDFIYVPILWLFWGIFKKPKNGKLLALCIWFLVPLIIFSFAQTKMKGYMLFTAPALFIITAAFFFEILKYRITFKPKWLLNIAIVLFIILPIRYGVERMKPFDQTDRNPQWVVDLKQLNEENIQNGVLFNYENPIEAMFYTNLTAYRRLPSKKTIEELIHQGYNVYVNDGDNLEEIKKIKEVTILRLIHANS